MSPTRPRRAETRPFPSKAAGSVDPAAYELVREESTRLRTQLEAFFSRLLWDIRIHQA
jgi:hypothetical protein